MSWLKFEYLRILQRYRKLPFPGRRSDFQFQLRGWDKPLFVRPYTSDIAVLRELFWSQEYLPAVERCPKPVKTIVALGGNVGYSVRYWQKYLPESLIIVLEPDPNNYRQLQKNIDAGGYAHRVTSIQSFAGDRAGEAFLDRSTESCMFRMSEVELPGSLRVTRTTISDLLNLDFKPAQRVDLFKCDIEGAETQLFSHCRNWIHHIVYIVVELHPPYNLVRFQENLRTAGVMLENPWFDVRPGRHLVYSSLKSIVG